MLAPAITKLFRFVVHRAKFPVNWKLGRVTPLHKRDAVSDAANYRPVTVVDNLESVFEDVLGDQFYQWLVKYIPGEQYGFLRGCGTCDYGADLFFKMLSCRERKQQGVLVICDVKGAFDRCWWSKLKVRLRKAGMRGRALRLIKDYLFERFIQIVCNGDASDAREIFSGVPQGGKWSPILWDFDISELPNFVCGDLGCYADDLWLWYEITDQNRDIIIDVINQDLDGLLRWADDNLTTFEPSKTAMMVVGEKRPPFDPTGVEMDGYMVSQVDSVKVIGFTFDSKLLCMV